jgi:hypothetical protein
MAGTLDGQAIFMASTTGTDRSEIGPYLGYLLAAIGNAFRLQPPMVHPSKILVILLRPAAIATLRCSQPLNCANSSSHRVIRSDSKQFRIST